MESFDVKNVEDKEFVNLKYLSQKYSTLVIDDYVNEVTFTSDSQVCYCLIFMKDRKSDLRINIYNLKVQSDTRIAMDLRGSERGTYKISINFSGENSIISKKNIAICINNNRHVNINGINNGILYVEGGYNCPGIGNNEYTSGSGELSFGGLGEIFIKGGDADLSRYCTVGENGGHGISFYDDNLENKSIIRICESIRVRAEGGVGQGIYSRSLVNSSGSGGCAIYIKGTGYIIKEGDGELELIGGNGGKSIGDFCCGILGKGGAAISLKDGVVDIKKPAILLGGNGGSIDCNNKNVMSKGGDGGYCIETVNYSTNKDVKRIQINLDHGIKVKGGDGGNSGIYLENNVFKNYEGGDGGGLYNSNNVITRINIGDIEFVEGNGGKSCNEHDNTEKIGDKGKLIIGENIILKPLDEKVNLYDDVIEINEMKMEDKKVSKDDKNTRKRSVWKRIFNRK